MRFTVLTATYNRAHCLSGVYESLCAQTFRDFEWVIVDDGSTDETKELVASWKSFFPIRYTWKPNGGMHTAINAGVALASGQLLAKLDSDDRCVPHALERFDYHWRQIQDPDRFAFVVALCYQENGVSVHGSKLPKDHMDVFGLGAALALTDAERWGTVRTDILRRFPFPEFKNERDIPEGVVWYRILRKYGARYINEPLRIYVSTAGTMSRSGDRRWQSPKSAVVFHTELALSDVPFKIRVKSAINAARFSLVAVFRSLLIRH